VVRKKTPWNEEGIKEATGVKEETEDGKTYYVKAREAVYLADAKTLVMGSEDSIKAAIKRGPDSGSDLAEKFSFMPKGQIVVGALADDMEDFTR